MNATFLKNKFIELEKHTRKLQQEKRLSIISEFGSIYKFYSLLTSMVINKPKQVDFKEVFRFYSGFFTLPEETETFDGFETTLALNENETLQNLYGGFEEAWIYIREPLGNTIIGAINFCLYKTNSEELKSLYAGTAHITYIFVSKEYRSLGLAKFLIQLTNEYADKFIETKGNILFFCEQNAPELMTAKEYFLDNINALVDQCDRLIWWDKQGYKRLVFNYTQPPLNNGKDACRNLTINVKTQEKTLPSILLKFHLERFFNLAIFKGVGSINDSHYNQQMKMLDGNFLIQTKGDVLFYQKLKEKIYTNLENHKPLKKIY